MRREDLQELHYITHVGNVPSICERGILSHRRAGAIKHISVAHSEVQDRRRGKRVPGGLLLHDYANLYMTARNPMLYLRARANGLADELCVLQVSQSVLDLPDVVVTDMNAASPYCRFSSVADGLEEVDAERVFRHYWTEGDALEQERCKKAKCAEVLVPGSVDPGCLEGIYAGTKTATGTLESLALDLEITLDADLFFNP
ncbi:MAG TPA: DUF4433 domain-containing protein [Solirubrobacterales bacterium]|nr:DUF4433 domain-containing protein [Solirubrobacterales bacterium]